MTIIVIKFSQLSLPSKLFYMFACCCKPLLWYMRGYHRKFWDTVRANLFFATNYAQNFFRLISIKNQNRCLSRSPISISCPFYLFKGPKENYFAKYLYRTRKIGASHSTTAVFLSVDAHKAGVWHEFWIKTINS